MTIRQPPPLNRELSLLAFNRRVLALAGAAGIPLLERLRFLCILGSNLDEFFEIRVAGIKEHLRSGHPPVGSTLPQVRALLREVGTEVRALITDQYRLLNDEVLPALAQRGVHLVRRGELKPSEREWVAREFAREVRPLLTPIGLDPAHPFPQVVNKSLNFIVEMAGRDACGRGASIAVVKAPRVLPRVIRLPAGVTRRRHAFVMLSSVIHAHLESLFPGRRIVNYAQFRVTRDADLWIDEEEEVKNLREALQGELVQRHYGAAVRLEVPTSCPDHLVAFLLQQFELGPDDLYRCDGPVNIARLAALADEVDVPELKYPPFVPGIPAALAREPDILAAIRAGDVLLHHPYQSFAPVVEFIRRAADDPDVVSVKQTVYRTGVNSALMEALIEAARRGKEVTVVIELMARFDEETNINWAERLEHAGAQVVHGVFGLKIHAKLALIVRRETDRRGRVRLARYAHLGTGNYHPRTTRLYSDFGLLTCDPVVCADVDAVFNHVTSLARPRRLNRLLLAPFTMHRQILARIGRETRNARAGKPARIVAKMNALVEEGVIGALYAASQAGVQIDLIVRGACALRPGVRGLSDRIEVRSILGRFLEHHRAWLFFNAGDPEVWLSSADWMGRNLWKRIEVAFPVRDPALKRRVADEGLLRCLADTRDAWRLHADGRWSRVRPRRGAPAKSAQAELLELLAKPDRDRAGAGSDAAQARARRGRRRK